MLDGYARREHCIPSMDTSEARAYSLERSFALAGIHRDDHGALAVLNSCVLCRLRSSEP